MSNSMMELQKMIERPNELQVLENEFKKDFSFIIMNGRRRVGKTTLLENYTRLAKSRKQAGTSDKGVKVLFYTVNRINDFESINIFKDLVATFINKDYLKNVTFTDWESVFNLLDEVDEKFVLVIDEFPYLIKANKNIPYIMQGIVDKKLKNKKMQIILSGSSLSIMTDQVLAYKSPLYGRRTAQINLAQFDFVHVANYFKDTYSLQDIVYIYSCTGGIPYYFQQFDTQLSVQKNIHKLFLNKSGLLYEEGTLLLETEFNESKNYRTILKFIGNGAYRLGEIASSTGIEKNSVSWYMEALIKAGFVRSTRPYFSKEGSKETLYTLGDNYLKFYYRFVYPNRSQIDREIDVEIEKQFLHTHIGRVYENIVREHLIRKHRIDFLPQWGKYRETEKGKKISKPYEIDLVGCTNKTVYVYDIKWSKLSVQDVHTIQSELHAKIEILKKQLQPDFKLTIKVGVVCRDLEATLEQKNELGVTTLDDLLT